jgi:phage terminase small subunit
MKRNPPCPSGLGFEAKRYWKCVCKNWHLTEDDLELLRQAVFPLDTVYRCREKVKEEGFTIDVNGVVRQHPAIKLELRCREQFLRAVKQLGLEDEETKRPPGRPPAW